MAGTTTTQNLPYATGGDPIVAAGEALESLAKRVEARLNSQQAALNLAKAPPLTVVESVAPYTMPEGDVVNFDTVLWDTQGGADLASFPGGIKINRTGYWCLGAYVSSDSTPLGISINGVLSVESDLMSNGPRVRVSHGDVGNGIFLSASTIGRANTTQGVYVFCSLYPTGSYAAGAPHTLTLRRRRMWAYWLGDF